jgi:hypothetical protein
MAYLQVGRRGADQAVGEPAVEVGFLHDVDVWLALLSGPVADVDDIL